jgi:hypothetical protein
MEKNPNQLSRRPPEKEKEWRALQEIAQPLGGSGMEIMCRR